MVGPPPDFAGKFSLIDHHGNAVTEADFFGQHALYYFGFTHCRVVCPRSLSKLTKVISRLEEAGKKITALYVTVDPERDTVERMKMFLDENFPKFTGLTGSAKQIESAKKSFRIFAERQPDDEDPDGYAVPHTAIAYLINPQGEYVGHFPDHLDEKDVFTKAYQLITPQ